MVKKSIIFVIIIALVLVVAGIFTYNFLIKKDLIEKISLEEILNGKENISVPEIIENGETITEITSDGGITGGTGGGGGGGGSGASSPGGADSNGIEYYTSQQICQNAQTDDLCNGLDITYGEGYRTVCCSEYNLCC